MKIDPVCGAQIDDQDAEFHIMFAGKKYFFCSDECRKEFEESPQDYLETAA